MQTEKKEQTVGEVIKADFKTIKTNRRYSEYDHIELTPEEAEDALAYRRMLKGTAMEEEEKKKIKNDVIKKYKEAWTASQLKSEVMDRTRQLPFEFKIDKDNERIIELLCLFYTNDPKFNEETFTYSDGKVAKLSLHKGIGLVSPTKGTGKTILSTLFQQNRHRPYMTIETKSIAAMYLNKGEKAIEIHSNLLHIQPHPNFFYFDKIGIAFDDLGYENEKNSWGNKSDVMSDVLFTIYSANQLKGDFSWWQFTSNLGGKSFEERFGDRIRDRMREMFNLFIVPGKSRRE